MFFIRICCVLLVLTPFISSEDIQNSSIRAVIRVYDECQKAETGFSPCIKKKAITFLDRVKFIKTINIGEGVNVVRSEDIDYTKDDKKPLTDAELEQTLPRGLEAREDALTDMLVDKAAQFISGRTIKVTLPKISPDEIGRGLEEGTQSTLKIKRTFYNDLLHLHIKMYPLLIN